MKNVTSVFVRSILGIVLVAIASGGCASEPVAGNDPSQWELPDVDISDPYRMTVERLLELESGTPLSPPLPGWSNATTTRIDREQAGIVSFQQMPG